MLQSLDKTVVLAAKPVDWIRKGCISQSFAKALEASATQRMDMNWTEIQSSTDTHTHKNAMLAQQCEQFTSS